MCWMGVRCRLDSSNCACVKCHESNFYMLKEKQKKNARNINHKRWCVQFSWSFPPNFFSLRIFWLSWIFKQDKFHIHLSAFFFVALFFPFCSLKEHIRRINRGYTSQWIMFGILSFMGECNSMKCRYMLKGKNNAFSHLFFMTE